MSEEAIEKKVAIYCVHGMGQQMRFSTLDNVAQGISKATNVTNQEAVTFMLNGKVRQRLEMKLEHTSKEERASVHLYEAYWAPITEGQVSLIDVMQFLWSAGWNGIQQSIRPFKRRMFGGTYHLPIQKASFWHILLTLFMVLLLSALNAGAVLLTYDVILGEKVDCTNLTASDCGYKNLPAWLPGKYIDLVTLVLAWLSIALSSLGVLWFAILQRKALWEETVLLHK
jgi:hypothetical protein